ncbi:MAG: RluA family pseudouridine synthase [Cetobacterium sp.]
MKKFIIEPEYNNYTIGQYLKEVKGYSGRGIRNLEIYLNGKKVKASKKIKKLNRLLIKEQLKETGIRSIKMDLKIAYEDKNLLILDKPPFILVHPTTKKADLTLANGVINYFQETMGQTLPPRFYNRLDMNTSGLVVVTKNAFAQAYLQEKAKVHKFYKAIVKGIIEKDEFMVERPLGKEGDDLRRKEMTVENGGQEAKTKVTVLKRFPEENLTLVELELFTGRTHQIRAHLSLEGYPILGDELYGGADERANRQLLHSYKLIFTDVETMEEKTVEIGLPEDMTKILDIKK